MKFDKMIFLRLLLLALAVPQARAGNETFRAATQEVSASKDECFERNHFELSLVSGALFSPADLGKDFLPRTKTNFDYTQSELRIGMMLNSPWEAGILRGNFEALVGLGGGAVIHGPGTAMANGDLFLRYNFVQPHPFLVPFWQLGLGLNASDVARDKSQRIIGSTVEFVIQSSVGFRIPLNRHWSVEIEGIYQHISNADTADRNVGVNAFGGLLGTTYAF